MKIDIETVINAPISHVWDAYNNPADIKQWNAASDDWHTTESTVDLRPGGKFRSRMEARDGSAGFDFEGEYTKVVPLKRIEYRMGDGREVQVEFEQEGQAVHVKTVFDAETQNSPEMQRAGWQAILDNFKHHVENR